MEAALELGVEPMRHRAIVDVGKTGSISRKQARSAALAVKTPETASRRGSATSAAKVKRLAQTVSVWERFLGAVWCHGQPQRDAILPAIHAGPRETNGTGRQNNRCQEEGNEEDGERNVVADVLSPRCHVWL
jgi:hypothetical protein